MKTIWFCFSHVIRLFKHTWERFRVENLIWETTITTSSSHDKCIHNIYISSTFPKKHAKIIIRLTQVHFSSCIKTFLVQCGWRYFSPAFAFSCTTRITIYMYKYQHTPPMFPEHMYNTCNCFIGSWCYMDFFLYSHTHTHIYI